MTMNTITVVMADTYRTEVAIIHEGESRPYERRTVHIRLTDEQQNMIKPRRVGERGAGIVYEEIVGVWLEYICEEENNG